MQESNIIYELDMTAYARLYTYEPVGETGCAVTGYTASEPVCLMIPAVAPDGRVVVAIGDRAFEGQRTLRAVSLPDTVESVGRRAFAFCTELRHVRTGTGSHLSVIGERAFMGCERLCTLRWGHLSSLCAVGRHAFAHCTALRSVTLPDGLVELAPSLFDGCTALVHIRLPETLTAIRTGAFSACASLCTVRMPASLTLIEDCAFAWCGRLSELCLPDGACVISGSAFRECYAMEDILQVS